MTQLDPALAAALDAAQPGEYQDTVTPPIGWRGNLYIADTKLDAKDGDTYVVVEYQAEGYYWSDFKWLTQGGQPHEGKLKSVKILLRSFGYADVTGANLGAILDALKGQSFAGEMVAGSAINATTGQPYANTKITGPATAAAVVAPPAQQAAPVQQAPVQQLGQNTQGPAPQPVAAGVPAQDDIPF